MTKLTRYLVLLAGFALAMLMTAPTALAGTAAPRPGPETGPDSRLCHAATKKVEDIKEDISKILRHLPDWHDSQGPEIVRKLEVVKDPKPAEVVSKLDWIHKLFELKKDLLRALDWKHKVCAPPSDEHPAPPAEHPQGEDPEHPAEEAPAEHVEETAPATDFSQVHEVPVDAVDTGGGPA